MIHENGYCQILEYLRHRSRWRHNRLDDVTLLIKTLCAIAQQHFVPKFGRVKIGYCPQGTREKWMKSRTRKHSSKSISCEFLSSKSFSCEPLSYENPPMAVFPMLTNSSLLMRKLHLNSCEVFSWEIVSQQPQNSSHAKSFHLNSCEVSSCGTISTQPMRILLMWNHLIPTHVKPSHVKSSHPNSCEIFSCGIFSCEIFSCGIFSCEILSCEIISGEFVSSQLVWSLLMWHHLNSTHANSSHEKWSHLLMENLLMWNILMWNRLIPTHVKSSHVKSSHVKSSHVTSHHPNSCELPCVKANSSQFTQELQSVDRGEYSYSVQREWRVQTKYIAQTVSRPTCQDPKRNTERINPMTRFLLR